MDAEVPARRATVADLETVTDIITLAFATDPLWSWALSRPDGRTDHHRAFWRLFIEGSLRYPETWIAGDGEAAAVWIPPGGTEMTASDQVALEALVDQHLGSGAHRYFELLERFEEHHPDEDHYYLSLLGTHPDHRGRGVGMGLVTHTLTLIDEIHANAYLESSNPVNIPRYERLGFEVRGGFEAPDDGPTVAAMWRPAR